MGNKSGKKGLTLPTMGEDVTGTTFSPELGYENYSGGEASLNNRLAEMGAEEEAVSQKIDELEGIIDSFDQWDEGGSGEAIAFAQEVVRDMIENSDNDEIMNLTEDDLRVEMRSAIEEWDG